MEVWIHPISEEEEGFFVLRVVKDGVNSESLIMRKKNFDLEKEWAFLPLDIQRELRKAIEESSTKNENEFTWEILVGRCPKCGSDKTMDCEGIEGIDDGTVGLCRRCGFLWCTECGSALGANIDCGHWEVCDSCQISKNEDEDCGYSAPGCDIIQNWILSKGQRESGSSRDN